MIRSAALRLTLAYLAIIMALSIGFSMFVYNVSKREVQSSLKQQGLYYVLQTTDYYIDLNSLRSRQIANATRRLRSNLVGLNLLVLVGGGAISYVLAKRTLNPIERSLRAQSRFAADASHELRTPLTIMQTEIEVGLRNPKLDKTGLRKLLQSNLEEAGKLKLLSERLLQLAKGSNKDLPLGPVSLEDIALEAVGKVITRAQAKKISVKNSVKPINVIGDEGSLIDLLVILLDNAIKYSPNNKTVTVGAKQHGKHVLLTVTDKGYGIKKSDIPNIFDRFYRIDQSRTKNETSGYGLGLSIAKNIADHHKSAINIKSTVGKGSTFTVKLQSA